METSSLNSHIETVTYRYIALSNLIDDSELYDKVISESVIIKSKANLMVIDGDALDNLLFQVFLKTDSLDDRVLREKIEYFREEIIPYLQENKIYINYSE